MLSEIMHIMIDNLRTIYFQAGPSPCSSGLRGKRFLLGSCIARTSSEEDLHHLEEKRPISPGHRGTTWNGEETS